MFEQGACVTLADAIEATSQTDAALDVSRLVARYTYESMV